MKKINPVKKPLEYAANKFANGVKKYLDDKLFESVMKAMGKVARRTVLRIERECKCKT